MKTLPLLVLAAAFILTGCAAEKYTSEQYRDKAYSASLQGDAATAKRYGRKAVAMEPTLQWNRVSYGWCFFTLEKYPEALAEWKRAYRMDDRNGRINACLAIAYYKLGDTAEAVRYYGKQVGVDSDFGNWNDLRETTDHWKPKEKAALYAVYREWRASGKS